MILRVFIPRYLQVGDHDKAHYVYQIEVSTLGKFLRLEKRYSQFLALHNEVSATRVLDLGFQRNGEQVEMKSA